MFKKVIGQEGTESSSSSQSTPTDRSSQPPAPPVREQSSRGLTPSAPVGGGANTRNVLSTDVEIKGTVKFNDDLIVDGKIEGEIQSSGNLTVGENAKIKAEIKTGTVVVYGKVHGNLTATERVELKSSAEVIGDIKTKTLTIEGGAIFVGKSTVGTPSQAPASQKPSGGGNSGGGGNSSSK